MKSICFASVVIGLLAGGLHAADEAYVKQEWPQARVLVWAKPGASGYATSSRSWTQYASTADYLAKKDGRAAKRPPDKDSDIILPDAPDGRPYIAGYSVESSRRRGSLDHPQLVCRHVTIGKGAGLDGGSRTSRGRASFGRHPSDDTVMAIYGNVTIKDGGYMYGPRYFLGDRHTFIRMGKSPEPLDRSWIIRKANGATLTLLGEEYELAEGVAVESGRLVLHSNCQLGFGAGYDARIAIEKLRSATGLRRGGYVYVHKNAALEMRAGSRIGRITEPENIVADLRIEGLLQIGRPGDKKGSPAVIELGMGEGDGGFLRQYGGLYIRRTARVKNFGKLVITSHKRNAKASAGKGVSVFLERTVDLGAVSFDYLRPGGIAAVDIKTAGASVAGATFGEDCAAKGDELFSKFDIIDFSGGVGTVEFVDGLKTDCKILFPHAGRLMVRGKGNRTLQSFDLKSVHAVTIDGKRTEFSAKRPLNDKEKELRKLNSLWGDVPGKGQYGKYAKQKWPDCPVMIWAQPGTSGACSTGPNWLDETGTPCFEFPRISRQGGRNDTPPFDMLLPAADSPYAVTGWFRRGGKVSPLHRHLTIEQDACYAAPHNLHGNLWMKHGSGLNGLTGSRGGEFANIQPGLHRFLRFDGKRIPHRRGGIKAPPADSRDAVLAQFGYFSAGKGGTLELIGKIRSAADRLSIGGTGTMIISEGSELHEGSRSALWILQGATLALLQDAFAGTEMTQQRPQCYASMIVGGTLMIGLPDKPIRRDMRFALSGIRKDLISRDPGFSVRSTGSSFVLGRQGRFVIHSADPKKARVIFTMHDSKRAITRDSRYRAKASKARDMALWNPEGIGCYFAGRTEIDGIVFDRVYPGGIIVAPEARAKWKNVFYGKNNLAKPEKLYWDLKVEDEK